MTHPIANDRTHPFPFSMEGAKPTLTTLSLCGAALATAGVAWNIIRKGNQVQMLDIGILGVSWALFDCAKRYDQSRQNQIKQTLLEKIHPKPTSIIYSFIEDERDKKAFAHVNKGSFEICAIQELTMKLDQIRLEYLIDNAKKIHYPYQQLIPNLDLGPLATTFTENLEHTTKCIDPHRKEEDDLAYPKGFNKVRAFVTTTLKNAEAFQKLFPAAITTQLPSTFGPANWNRYFGDIGAVPPLPKNIADILNSPCPYWGGKKVYETHMLTLIPATLNGSPFTLTLLGQIIQNPQGGGHKTTYRYYNDLIREEIGGAPNGAATWSLITKDVIPESRNKRYINQTALLKSEYSTPKALELATAILMHQVQTGERLYSDNPNTYSRCEEKVDNNQWRVVIGSFGASGLLVYDPYLDDRGNDSIGLAGARKF